MQTKFAKNIIIRIRQSRDERFNKSDMENTISWKIMNNDNEKSPRHFVKIPDVKLRIHFIRPNMVKDWVGCI